MGAALPGQRLARRMGGGRQDQPRQTQTQGNSLHSQQFLQQTKQVQSILQIQIIFGLFLCFKTAGGHCVGAFSARLISVFWTRSV